MTERLSLVAIRSLPKETGQPSNRPMPSCAGLPTLNRFTDSFIFCSARLLWFSQKGTAYSRIDQVSEQCAKASICQKVVRHVDPVMAIQDYKKARYSKGDQIFPVAPFSRYIRKHGKAEHHSRYYHIAARPRLITVIASRKGRDHLPPVAELAYRII